MPVAALDCASTYTVPCLGLLYQHVYVHLSGSLRLWQTSRPATGHVLSPTTLTRCQSNTWAVYNSCRAWGHQGVSSKWYVVPQQVKRH